MLPVPGGGKPAGPLLTRLCCVAWGRWQAGIKDTQIGRLGEESLGQQLRIIQEVLEEVGVPW